jgi:predicted nucleic acid-binding Zn ribbon protein
VRRVNRPDTWQHRLASQHAHATLANGEPSTHGYTAPFEITRRGWPVSWSKPTFGRQSRPLILLLQLQVGQRTSAGVGGTARFDPEADGGSRPNAYLDADRCAVP